MTLERIKQEERYEGERNKAIDTAKKMLKYDEPLEKIELYTGLSPSEIEKLKKNTL